MAKYRQMRTTGGVTAIWTANRASAIKKPFDWSKVKRILCCTLTSTSGWQGKVVLNEEKGKD